MHPIIVFLSFIFSPTDEWLLKQAYQLVLSPEPVVSARAYEKISREYPSEFLTGSSNVSFDAMADFLWADIFSRTGNLTEASVCYRRLLHQEAPHPRIADDLHLRLGELALRANKIDEAEEHFSAVRPESPVFPEALTSLLVVDLIRGDGEASARRAWTLKEWHAGSPASSRAAFPLGLAAFAEGRYPEAVDSLKSLEEDPRGRYFTGLSYRAMGQTQAALEQWTALRRSNTPAFWKNLAMFQLSETYFSIEDDGLARRICETALADIPNNPYHDAYEFRLATLDFRGGNFERALERLASVAGNRDYNDRGLVLAAESLVKLGRPKELVSVLAKMQLEKNSSTAFYQDAWISAFNNQHKKALETAEKGLETHYDAAFTPRLLLLQALCYERLGLEAEAMATFQTVADRFPNSREAAQSTHWITLAYARLGRMAEIATHGAYLWNQLSPDVRHDYPEAAFWIGEALLRLDRPREAQNYFAALLAMAPPDHDLVPYAHFQQSVALATTGHTDRAFAALSAFADAAKKRGREDWLSLAQLQSGHFLFNQKKFPEAIAAYIASGNSDKSLYYQAASLYRMDYFTDAMEKWKLLAKEYPESRLTETALFRVGRTEFELGYSTEAVATFAAFIHKYPNSPRAKDALLQSAHALYNAGNPSAASHLYADYLARHTAPDDLIAVTPYLAACYIQMGKSPIEAETLLSRLPAADVLADVQWQHGAESFNDKQYADAATVFAALLRTAPANEKAPDALFYRAESLFLSEEWPQAEAAYRHYRANHPAFDAPHSPLALFHEGVAAYRQDKLLDAGRLFEDFMARFPSHDLAPGARENLLLCYYGLGDWETMEKMKIKYPEKYVATAEAVPATAGLPEETDRWSAP